MLYEKLKESIARNARTAVMHGVFDGSVIYAAVGMALADRIPPRDAVQQLAQGVHDIIMDWDIRCIGKLRDMYKNWFPKHLQTGTLIAEYDDNGDWIIEKKHVPHA